MANSDFSCVETRFFIFGSRHCAAVLQTQVPKLCTNLDLSLFYILTLGTDSKFARKNNFLALGVFFPQPCSSAGCMFAALRSRLQYYRRIVSFPKQQIRWNALWTGFHWESAYVREIPNPTELKYFLIFTHLSEPGLISAGSQRTGSTQAGFQKAFRAGISSRSFSRPFPRFYLPQMAWVWVSLKPANVMWQNHVQQGA